MVFYVGINQYNKDVTTVYCLQDVGALITFPIAIYDVARPENMSLECNTADTDDTPPSGYHVVCIENMQAEYETVHVASAKAGKATPTTSENPPPLPPPMIRGDNNDRVLTEKATGSTSQAKDELIEDGGQEAKIAAQVRALYSVQVNTVRDIFMCGT